MVAVISSSRSFFEKVEMKIEEETSVVKLEVAKNAVTSGATVDLALRATSEIPLVATELMKGSPGAATAYTAVIIVASHIILSLK